MGIEAGAPAAEPRTFSIHPPTASRSAAAIPREVIPRIVQRTELKPFQDRELDPSQKRFTSLVHQRQAHLDFSVFGQGYIDRRAKICFLGAPWDLGTIVRTGTSSGPHGVREASTQYFPYMKGHKQKPAFVHEMFAYCKKSYKFPSHVQMSI